MNLLTSEVVAIIRFRLEEFSSRAASLKAEEREKAPEVAERLLEAAKELVTITKGRSQ